MSSHMSHWAKDLYIIQSGTTGAIKIGRTSDLTKRLHQLQTGATYPLKVLVHIPGAGHREANLHRRLKTFRIRDNGEWFRIEGMAELPDDIYCLIDLEDQDWWVTT